MQPDIIIYVLHYFSISNWLWGPPPHFIKWWGTTNLQLSNVLIVWPSYDLTCNLKGLNLPVKTFVLDNDSTVITIKANGLQSNYACSFSRFWIPREKRGKYSALSREMRKIRGISKLPIFANFEILLHSYLTIFD